MRKAAVNLRQLKLGRRKMNEKKTKRKHMCDTNNFPLSLPEFVFKIILRRFIAVSGFVSKLFSFLFLL